MTSQQDDKELERLASEAIYEYQELLKKAYLSGTSRVICIDDADGKPWYVEPHDAADDEDPAPPSPVQYLGHHEPDYGDRVAAPGEPSLAVVLKPPGALIVQLAAYLPGRTRLRRVLSQVVADMRAEYFDALAAKNQREADLAVWRGRLACLSAVFPSWVASLVGTLSRWFGLA